MRTRGASRRARRGAAVLTLGLAIGCVVPQTFDGERPPAVILEALDPAQDAPPSAERLRALERILAQTQNNAERLGPARFWASFVLARDHAWAADSPLWVEPVAIRPRIGRIGRVDAGEAEAVSPDTRPSPTAHVVAAIDNASRAQDLLALLGDEVLDYLGRPVEGGVRRLALQLQLTSAVAYTRLGFHKEVHAAVADAPELLDVRRCLAFLDENGIGDRLKPWICRMVSVHLREENEPDAYRFAILAIEGRERFGAALPSRAVAELEDWILRRASVRFVCPRSDTEYLPGHTASPISGIPHLDYVPAPRP